MKYNGMAPYMTVFPLPFQVQVINSPTILSQNPGYEHTRIKVFKKIKIDFSLYKFINRVGH